MKQIIRLSALCALITALGLPALAAPSDADMGFASVAEGSGGNTSSNVQATDSAGTGETTGNRNQKMNEANMYWGNNGNMSGWTSRNGRSGDIWNTSNAGAAKSEQTHQHAIQNTFKNNLKVETGLMAPESVSGVNVAGQQKLGFKWSGAGLTQNAARLLGGSGGRLPLTGTGSVNASICSPNGKD